MDSGYPSKLKMKAMLSIHGIFSIVTATLYERLVETAEAEGNGQEEEMEGMENQGNGKVTRRSWLMPKACTRKSHRWTERPQWSQWEGEAGRRIEVSQRKNTATGIDLFVSP